MKTESCPKCGTKALLHFESQNRKSCTDCGITFDWRIEEGQVCRYRDIKLRDGELVKK